MGKAIKMFEDEYEIGEKDGGGDEEVYIDTLHVEAIDNGWIIRATDSEGEDYVNVYQTGQGKEMVKAIAEALEIKKSSR